MIIWVNMKTNEIEIGDTIKFTEGGSPSFIVTEIRDENEKEEEGGGSDYSTIASESMLLLGGFDAVTTGKIRVPLLRHRH